MGTQEWIALITGLGGGPLILAVVRAVWRATTGREGRRRSEVDRAWQERDREATKRRRLEEFASLLRRRLLEAPCVDDSTVPTWPESTGPITTKKDET